MVKLKKIVYNFFNARYLHQKTASLKGWRPFKGTVSVISSEPACRDGYVRFTIIIKHNNNCSVPFRYNVRRPIYLMHIKQLFFTLFTVDQDQFEFERNRRVCRPLSCAASTGPTLSYAGSVSTLMARPDFLQYPPNHRPILPTPLAQFSVFYGGHCRTVYISSYIDSDDTSV